MAVSLTSPSPANAMLQVNLYTLKICGPVLSFGYLLWRFWVRRHRLPLPPGPRPKPFVGSELTSEAGRSHAEHAPDVFDVPRSRPCLKYLEWAERYGPIVYLDVAGKPTIILNTYEAATDLMDKKGQIYSDRPRLIMVGELVGGCSLTLSLPSFNAV